jgi:hypothetical protein
MSRPISPQICPETSRGKILAWKILRHLGSIATLVLLGGLLSATFVRLAPGADADEHELDPSLSADSVRVLRQSRAGEKNIFSFYRSYLRRAIHGDLGTSHALGQPVKNLLRERWPVTARLIGLGLLLAWIFASALSFTACLWPRPAYEAFGITLSGAFRGLSPGRTPRHFRHRELLARFPAGCARFPVGLEKFPEGFARRRKLPGRGPRRDRFELRTVPRNEKRQRCALPRGTAREKENPLKGGARFSSKQR